ncbi:MAG: outer membrane protein assembly factor BamE [Rubrivivax sp.]|nr:outer membrane protein assembly factor BamE [Rubrivivax sp.]
MKAGGDVFGFIRPYRIDIIQGNVVTQEQVDRVKPGMTRRQVRDLLGSPMLTDLFHADRWDYPFAIRRQGAEPQKRDIVVRFEGDKLLSIESPPLPSEREFVAAIARGGDYPERNLELSEEQLKALPVPPPRDEPPVEPTGAVRSYPPLEAP